MSGDPLAGVRVLVTRPEREAQPWVQALLAQGVQAESLPLMEIAALTDTSGLVHTWATLDRHWALMFVSANAVRHFVAARPSGTPMPDVLAWGTGPGTRAALLEAGWPPVLIRCPDESSPQFDSEALWAQVLPEVHKAVQKAEQLSAPLGAAPSVLIVRGADAQGQMAGRDWLAQHIVAAGLSVAQCAAYARQAPRLTPAQRARAEHALSQGDWWLFSSSEAAVHLQQAMPGASLAQARALATHPRIAERLRQFGWGRVVLVPAALDEQSKSIKLLT